jgi:Heparinase II/III-like protein/Heparinase II/III N-terminus
MTRLSTRLRQMERAELAWRARSAAHIAGDRVTTWLRRPRWDRRRLAPALAAGADLGDVQTALAAGRWAEAHRALAAHYRSQEGGFVIAPRMRSTLVGQIAARFPESGQNAAGQADQVLAGRYDILGYRKLAFDGRDWHRDVVHDKRVPVDLWSNVRYLERACGDHKVIWELNRHQHWMLLGRAYWLTGDDRYRTACLSQLDSWLDGNPPLMGVNWASMLELGLRSLSWLWALNFFADSDGSDTSPWIVDLLLGLDRQLTHVERHLSFYFSPNTHLVGEALALYVAGRTLPELKASRRRAELGRTVLRAEIARQIAGDGGHCERSAHYHRYALDFYLLALAVARLTHDPVADEFASAVDRLATAARALADDNGRLPHLGDDDGGTLLPLTRRAADDIRDSLYIAGILTGRAELLIGDPPEEVFWMLGQPAFAQMLAEAPHLRKSAAPSSLALPETGYYISRSESGDHMVIDGGPHGFLNCGHAHADALSLTFTRRGLPLLIDPGTGCYTIDPKQRDRFRSTALHNTLTVDDRPQSVPHGPFHWQHIANGAVRRWRENQRFDYFDGTHDGYQPLTHRRHVLALHDDLLIVADCVVGQGVHTAKVQWLVDPAWAVCVHERGATFSAGEQRVSLTVAGGEVASVSADAATGIGWHAPVYGRVEPATSVSIESHRTLPLWIFSVFGLDAANPVLAVEPLSLIAPAGTLQHSTALCITRRRSVEHVLIAEPVGDVWRSTWRLAGIETDARMLWLRREERRGITRLGLVDATMVKSRPSGLLNLSYPTRVRALSLEPLAVPEGLRACAELPDSSPRRL